MDDVTGGALSAVGGMAGEGGDGDVSSGGSGDGDGTGAANSGGSTGGVDGTGGSLGGATSGGSGGSDSAGGSSAFCPAETYVFCDDFEDTDPSEWTISGGNWVVLGEGEGYYYEGTGSQEAHTGESTWTTQSVEAKVKVENFGDTTHDHRVGLVGRYANSSNFYVFSVRGDGNASLLKSTSAVTGGGTCDPLPIPEGVDVFEWFDMRLEISGSPTNVILKTFINGEQIHGCTNNANMVTQGGIGLSVVGSASKGAFDDVRVSL